MTLDHEHTVELMELATEMLLPRLVNICEEFIKSNATVDTICDIWLVSNQLQAFQLWKFCKYFIKLKLANVKQMSNFENLTPELIKELDD